MPPAITTFPTSRPAAESHQHFNGLDQSGEAIAFPGPGADRAFLSQKSGSPMCQSLLSLSVRAKKRHPRNDPRVANDELDLFYDDMGTFAVLVMLRLVAKQHESCPRSE